MTKPDNLNGAVSSKCDFQIAAQQLIHETKGKATPPISFRVNEKERAELKRAAAGTSLSDHIRHCLFVNGKAKGAALYRSAIKDDAALAQVLGLLGRSHIANNLNQLAKLGHCGALMMDQETLDKIDEVYVHVVSMRSALIRALGLIDGGKR